MSFVLHPQLANDTFFITDLPLCRVLLMNESRYPWLILVPRRAEIREIYELTPEDRQQFWQERARSPKANALAGPFTAAERIHPGAANPGCT